LSNILGLYILDVPNERRISKGIKFGEGVLGNKLAGSCSPEPSVIKDTTSG
jgi:hypothetical protein